MDRLFEIEAQAHEKALSQEDRHSLRLETWRSPNHCWKQRTINFVQRKTGSSVQIPIHQDLYEYLLKLPGSNRAKKPGFPKLFDKPGAGKSGLSMPFKRLMERAGIDDGVARKKDGRLGRDVSRL
jgi:hypothetical protein